MTKHNRREFAMKNEYFGVRLILKSTRSVLHLKHAKKVSKIHSPNYVIFRTFNNKCQFEENHPKKKSLISTDHGDNSSGQPKCASSSCQSHRTLRFHCSIPQIFLLPRSFLLDGFLMLELESSKKKGMGGDYTDSSFCTTQE